MRCYACDRINSTHFDGETGRFYCKTCMNIILETAGLKESEDLTTEPVSVTLEELVEDEREIADAIKYGGRYASDLSEM